MNKVNLRPVVAVGPPTGTVWGCRRTFQLPQVRFTHQRLGKCTLLRGHYESFYLYFYKYGCANFEIDTPITRYAIYLIILLRWLFAFSGFDLPTRLPVAFFLALALALWAKGFFLFATIYKGVRF